MGTRATVGMLNDDGTVTEIYTHWDGYPSHHAPILVKHYATPGKVCALLALGDLSILDVTLGEKHDFDTIPSAEGVCTAYGRDRGEKNVAARTHANLRAFNKKADHEYTYLYRDGAWYCRRSSDEYVLLTGDPDVDTKNVGGDKS